MKRLVFGAWIFTVAACDDATRSTAPSVTPPAVSSVTGGARQFTVRFLTAPFSVANAINEEGEVVGAFTIATGEIRPFLWRAGQGVRDLGTLGGEVGQAIDINDRTEVVGTSEIRSRFIVPRAFFWTKAGGMRGLGIFPGEFTRANAINNRREVVGGSEDRQGGGQAFLWVPGRGMRNLGTLGGPNSTAMDVNDATQVVGASNFAPSGAPHAFLWTAQRGMEDLGILGGTFSAAAGISETGAVVGISTTAAGTDEAFLWTRGSGMRSLGTLGGSFSSALSVNTHRRVVGSSTTATGKEVPFLWTPEHGMQRLPTRGAFNSGVATDVNEFGQIVGILVSEASGEQVAALWTPTAGPLASELPDEAAVPEVATSRGESREARAAWCHLGRKLGPSFGYGMLASSACLAR